MLHDDGFFELAEDFYVRLKFDGNVCLGSLAQENGRTTIIFQEQIEENLRDLVIVQFRAETAATAARFGEEKCFGFGKTSRRVPGSFKGLGYCSLPLFVDEECFQPVYFLIQSKDLPELSIYIKVSIFQEGLKVVLIAERVKSDYPPHLSFDTLKPKHSSPKPFRPSKACRQLKSRPPEFLGYYPFWHSEYQDPQKTELNEKERKMKKNYWMVCYEIDFSNLDGVIVAEAKGDAVFKYEFATESFLPGFVKNNLKDFYFEAKESQNHLLEVTETKVIIKSHQQIDEAGYNNYVAYIKQENTKEGVDLSQYAIHPCFKKILH